MKNYIDFHLTTVALKLLAGKKEHEGDFDARVTISDLVQAGRVKYDEVMSNIDKHSFAMEIAEHTIAITLNPENIVSPLPSTDSSLHKRPLGTRQDSTRKLKYGASGQG